MKTIKGATTSLAAGTVWGTIVASWYDVPRVERNVALPGLIRTVKLMGNYGLTFAAIGGIYIGVEQLMQQYRMKRDFINGAAGGFAAGATVLGYKGRSISTAISAGAALAFTSAILDIGGQTTRIDNVSSWDGLVMLILCITVLTPVQRFKSIKPFLQLVFPNFMFAHWKRGKKEKRKGTSYLILVYTSAAFWKWHLSSGS
ncbi:hypothetical protein MRB53_017563 [Persea americana]|uniref:Uncharacterized protein n=1 Tax=Persea americana TaxID=3435 RepID=A0ACC2M5C0_PERAE|nr:hypothetical protein MRB53_017563 [Persea americana]